MRAQEEHRAARYPLHIVGEALIAHHGGDLGGVFRRIGEVVEGAIRDEAAFMQMLDGDLASENAFLIVGDEIDIGAQCVER